MSAETNTKTTYRHYAFISYSSKDIKWAKRLQRMLETYRLPVRLRKEHMPDKVYPVFRDDTDLSGFKVRPSLQRELEDSRYLIVICSPNSAASQWVNDEVEYFISLGRGDRILPFIIGGKAEAAASPPHFMPPALLGEDDLRGISVPKLGMRCACLNAIATLLNVEYDSLVQRDKKRRLIRNSALSFAALALALGIYMNLPHAKYYSSYIYRNEIPQGVNQLSAQEREGLSHSYRITRQRGRIIRLETVNSKGEVLSPFDSDILTEYPRMEYDYDRQGKLVSVDQYDEQGIQVARKTLSYNPAQNQIAIEFRQAADGTRVSALSADMSFSSSAYYDQSAKSEITRQLGTYDENGLLTKLVYQQNSLGAPCCDSNGVYGKAYSYNELGQITAITNLNEAGLPHNCKYGWAELRLEYNENGRISLHSYYDSQGRPARASSGISAYAMSYDHKGNRVALEHLDENLMPINDQSGYSLQKYIYSEEGFLLSSSIFDTEGKAACLDGYHEYRFEYDSHGRRTKTALYNGLGEACCSRSGRYSYLTFLRDDHGCIVEEKVFGVNGEAVPSGKDNCCAYRYEYDAMGYICAEHILDAEGNPIEGSLGYASVLRENNTAGQPLRLEYRDTSGALVRNAENYAIIQNSYDVFGNLTKISYYDELGIPCYSIEGCSSIGFEYKDGKLISQRYFDTAGNAALNSQSYHECRYEYDAKGNCIRISYYNTKGQLSIIPDNYALTELRYDEYGNAVEKSYYDELGNPAITSDSYCRVLLSFDGYNNLIEARYESPAGYPDVADFNYMLRYEYDRCGNPLRVEYYDKNGEPVSADEERSTAVVFSYDESGNVLSRVYLDENGLPKLSDIHGFPNLERYSYDELGNIILQQKLHKDSTGAEQLITQTRFEYDPYGNCTRLDNLNAEGKADTNWLGGYSRWDCASILRSYTPSGLVLSVEYFNADGSSLPSSMGAARTENSYDNMGNLIEVRQYDAYGNPLRQADGLIACTKYSYDRYGNMCSITDYNEYGEFFDRGEGRPTRNERSYDIMSYIVDISFYDSENRFLKKRIMLPVIAAVYPGSNAESLGIQSGDFVLGLDSWSFFDETLYSKQHSLKAEINLTKNSEKTVLLCRLEDNGSFSIFRADLPKGALGVRFSEEAMDEEILLRVEEACKSYSKS